MTKTLRSTEAVRHFGDVLARVKYTGESIVLTKGDQPMARLVPVPGGRSASGAEIMDALAHLPHDPDFAADLERVNQRDRVLENPWA